MSEARNLVKQLSEADARRLRMENDTLKDILNALLCLYQNPDHDHISFRENKQRYANSTSAGVVIDGHAFMITVTRDSECDEHGDAS